MKILLACILTISIASSIAPADAKGFLSALLRGSAKTATRAGVQAGVHSYAAPTKTDGTDTLTVEQIEACIKAAQALDKSSEYVEAMSAAINSEGGAISRAQQSLSIEKDLVDRYSDASVNAYNKKLAAMRTRINAHNANVDRGQAEQVSHNARVGSYNAECAKKYYADDMEAARVKLGLKDDAK
jgi:hypothetical protein